MIDAVTAGLIGAGIGFLGSSINPLLTARRADRARRQEAARLAYVKGGIAVVEAMECLLDGDTDSRSEKLLYAAHVEIRILGDMRAVNIFASLCTLYGSSVRRARSEELEGGSVEILNMVGEIELLYREFMHRVRVVLGVASTRHRLMSRIRSVLSRRRNPASPQLLPSAEESDIKAEEDDLRHGSLLGVDRRPLVLFHMESRRPWWKRRS